MSQEIRVRFESCDGTDGDGRFRVTFTVAGTECGVAVEFAPFLTDADYENLRWYLEEYMDLPDGGAVVRSGHRAATAPVGPPAVRFTLCRPRKPRTPETTPR